MFGLFKAKPPPPPEYTPGDAVTSIRGLLVLGGYVDPGVRGVVLAVEEDRITVDFPLSGHRHRARARVKLHRSLIKPIAEGPAP